MVSFPKTPSALCCKNLRRLRKPAPCVRITDRASLQRSEAGDSTASLRRLPCQPFAHPDASSRMARFATTGATGYGHIQSLFLFLRAFLMGRAAAAVENLALRQQVAVFKQSVKRPKLRPRDRVFWVLLFRLWPNWRSALAVVQPETVIRWHRKGFKRYWRWKSRRGKPGRPPIEPNIRDPIRRMSRENPTWGAPRIVWSGSSRSPCADRGRPGLSSPLPVSLWPSGAGYALRPPSIKPSSFPPDEFFGNDNIQDDSLHAAALLSDQINE